MDQDGNTVTPRTPNFSSPNIQSNDNQNPPVEQPTAVPMEPANPTITAAAAAMTDADPRTAITSAPTSVTPPARGFFGTRFKAKQNTAAASATSSAFDGAPDFFKEAAAQNSDFIAVGEQPAQSNKKRFIVIGAVAIAIIGIVAAVIFLNPAGLGGGNADFSKEDKQKIAKLYDDYTSLLQHYRIGNGKPSDVLSRKIQDDDFAIVDPYVIANYKKTIPMVKEDLNSVRDIEKNSSASKQKKTALSDVVNTMEQNIGIMDSNIKIMEEFKEAFDDPAMLLLKGEKKPTNDCKLSESATKLSEGNSKESSAAQKYSAAYCELNDIILSNRTFNKGDTITEFVEAKKALAETFEDISENIIDTSFLEGIKDGAMNEK